MTELVVTARQQGNSTVLTVPKSFNISQGTRFHITKYKDGSIIYTPEDNYNIWTDKSLDDFDYVNELKQEYEDLGYNPREIKPVGKELPNND